jgi:hypothetical protein
MNLRGASRLAGMAETSVYTEVMVFWIAALCGVVDEYQHFEGQCYLHLEDEVHP